jgi:peroxiredoxin
MKKLLLIFFSLIVISIFLFNSCQINKDPIEILKKADNARMMLKSASFEAEYFFTSANEEKPVLNKSKLTIARNPEENEFGIKVRNETLEGNIFTYDGNTYKDLNISDKRMSIAESNLKPYSFITSSYISGVIDLILSKEKLFTHLLENPENISFAGITKVNGIDCFIIKIKHADEEDIKDWIETYFIGKDDSMIRKYERTRVMAGDLSKKVITIIDLKTNIQTNENLFTLTAPKDFKIEKITETKEPDLLAEGIQAPQFTLKDPTGKDVSLNDFKGRVVVLDFWGTWCIWCVKALPKINALYETYKGRGVEVIGISCKEAPKADPAGFLKKKNITYTLLLKGEEVAKRYNVFGFPTLYIIGKDGKIVHSHLDYTENMDKELGKIIEENL